MTGMSFCGPPATACCRLGLGGPGEPGGHGNSGALRGCGTPGESRVQGGVQQGMGLEKDPPCQPRSPPPSPLPWHGDCRQHSHLQSPNHPHTTHPPAPSCPQQPSQGRGSAGSQPMRHAPFPVLPAPVGTLSPSSGSSRPVAGGGAGFLLPPRCHPGPWARWCLGPPGAGPGRGAHLQGTREPGWARSMGRGSKCLGRGGRAWEGSRLRGYQWV